LGNIYSRRDWGHARDYVVNMYKILTYKKPDDFVISTGTQYSIKEFVMIVCDKINMKIKWRGAGLNERAYDKDGNKVIEISKKFFRPLDVVYLLGDCSKAKRELNWKPKRNIGDLVSDMIDYELEEINVSNN
jgi:GDPmannose 4,6-dehydratase